METEYFLELRGVTKRFGETTAVQPTNLQVRQGSFLTIVGPSGCGKTTLLQMIAGFLSPDDGHISLHGKDVREQPPHKRSIGMVFQKLALFPHMTAAQNIAYPLKMRRFEPSSIPDRVEKYLKLVQLSGFADRRPHELSGGQQQRVAIARALSFSPDLLLLDEPLSALDKKLREEMQLEFRRIQQELGVTTVNVTHDQREALVMSDQIVVMCDGRVQQDDSPKQIYLAPSNRFVASFVGLTSVFPAEIESVADAQITLGGNDKKLSALTNSYAFKVGQTVDYAIRAEQIRILGDRSDAYANVVEGIIKQRIFEGDRIVYEALVPSLNNVSLFVADHDSEDLSELEIGSRVRLAWRSRDGMVFPTEPA